MLHPPLQRTGGLGFGVTVLAIECLVPDDLTGLDVQIVQDVRGRLEDKLVAFNSFPKFPL